MSIEAKIIMPYEANALEPYFSETAIKLHLLHHEAYVNAYKKFITDQYREFYESDLEYNLMKLSYELEGIDFGPIKFFQNAAQVWNHNFFWASMAKDNKPSEKMLQLINESYGSINNLRNSFIEAGMSTFGSCWLWIVAIDRNVLDLMVTSNADSPKFSINSYHTVREAVEQDSDIVPLIGCDVWEHSFYPDYQNRKREYLTTFFDHLINWDFAEQQLSSVFAQYSDEE